jgi:MFS-type transporter involved in bile tolerance (Atg22 family)
LGGALARNVYLYWFIAALVGLTLGSTWVIFRALALNLVPAEKIGEIFGLFNLVGYLSSILGSLFWATLLLLLNPLGELRYRIALLSLALFMLLSLIFLWRVPDTFKREP